MGTWDRIGRSLFVAAAVGMAWGIRGDYGHVIGAMYPGAVLGLAWVAVAGSPALLRRMGAIAGLTAAAIGAGGTMSYGILHGYAQADTLPNYAYGLLTLFLQGGCWGTFGGGLAGLMCERRPVRSGEWAGLVGSVFLGGWLMSAVVVEWIGFQVNPPRNNISVTFLGAAVGQFAWLAWTRRMVGLRGAAFGFAGFGLGMAGGRVLGNAAVHLEAWGYTINHWNVMEITCGFVGGGVFTWGMLGLGRVEPDEECDEFRGPSVLGAAFVLAVIPLWHLLARVPEKLPAWTKQLGEFGSPDPAGLMRDIVLGLDMACAVGVLGAVMWGFAIARGWRWPPWLPAVWLSGVMLAFQQLTSLDFWRPARPGYLNTHLAFWALFLLMPAYLLVSQPDRRPAEDLPATWFRVGLLVLVTAGVFGALIGLASITNGERTMRAANTRWPIWTWNDGPFPGRGKGP